MVVNFKCKIVGRYDKGGTCNIQVWAKETLKYLFEESKTQSWDRQQNTTQLPDFT